MTGKALAAGVFKAVLIFGVLATGFWTITHRQQVVDWWFLRSYTPSSDVVALADANTLVGAGRDFFYASDPKVEDSQSFNLHCNDVGEKGSVLGCFTPTLHIYLYNVTDSRLPHVKEVTAAHEMLHAAYARLDSGTKQKVDLLVQAEADRLKDDASLQDILKLYAVAEPGERLNELHSIIGTEYGNVSPELETYYKQYFSDRSKVIAYAQEYKHVFAASKARLATDDARLAGLSKTIKEDEAELNRQRAVLDSENVRLTNLRKSDPQAYNQQVPAYNSKVAAFNSLARTYNNLVKEYNDLVETRNKEAAAQNDLYHSLDSKYQPVAN